MIPAPFDYEVAESVEHALELLGSREDAKLLAGGHSLLPLMKLRFARPVTLVDIGRLSELAGVRNGGGDQLAIGALTRHHDLANDPLVQQHCPLLAHTASLVGDSQVRHRGTIGGSLAHGDPASDLSTIALTLDAEIVARGPNGERVIAAGDFFRAFFQTALEPNEVITEVRVTKTGAGWSYIKFRRRALDWATVGVAAVVEAGDGGIASARIGLTNMGHTPLRAKAAEQALAGAAREGVAAAAEKADEGTDPPEDSFATADFRRHLSHVLTARAVEEALSR